MDKKNIYEPIFDGVCDVCGAKMKKDVYKQGDCSNCGWKNNADTDENPDIVVYPNLISLNKAKKLYKQGKPFEPDLDEFIEALHQYSEVQFKYNGVYYGVELVDFKDDDFHVQLFNSQTKQGEIFNNYADFKNGAKIDGKFLKDIWSETTDRNWLQ